MPWYPISVKPTDYFGGKPVGKEGYYIVNMVEKIVDIRYLFPTKHEAYGECARRNNSREQLEFKKT